MMIKKLEVLTSLFFPDPQIPCLKDHVYLVHTVSFILSEEKLESFGSGGGYRVTAIDT